MTQEKKLSKSEYIYSFWKNGFLKYKLHSVQKEMYDVFYNSEKRSILVWLLARQSGKSYLLAVLALEHALKQNDSIVKLVTDTKLHVKSIFEKIFKELLTDCPEEFKPKYTQSDFTYYFPNGSQIQMAGTDGKNYEKLRGQKATVVLVDEAGFCNDLEDAVMGVLFPTTTHTGGKIVLATTPSEDPDHEFFKFMEEAESKGLLSRKTLDDNPIIPAEEKLNIEKAMGGRTAERFRREYLVEVIRDSSRTVLPEFTQDAEVDIVKEHPRPPYFDGYVGMDLGGKDLTFQVYGYYDFRADKIVIEDELVLDFSKKDVTLKTLFEQGIAKEEKLWTNMYTNEVQVPFKRVSDIDYIAIKELSTLSFGKYHFTVTKKDEKQTSINHLRMLIQNKKIIINPRCVNLIRHLRNVKWRSEANKEVFARSPDNGHYDGVDALLYLIRNIDVSRNPYPTGYGMSLSSDTYYQSGNPNKIQFDRFGNPITTSPSQQIETYKKIFGMNKIKR